MGAAAMVGLTLATGIWKAKTEYDANKAAARQAQANADIAYLNAEKKDTQAHETAQNNALNQEVKRRQIAAKMAADVNSVGASGLTMSGSNQSVLADNHYNYMMDLGIDSYNGRKNVDNIFQESTDFVNQGDHLKEQAKQYKKAAKKSLIKNAIETGASIAMIYGGGSLGSASKTSSAASTAGDKVWVGNIPKKQAVAKGLWKP